MPSDDDDDDDDDDSGGGGGGGVVMVVVVVISTTIFCLGWITRHAVMDSREWSYRRVRVQPLWGKSSKKEQTVLQSRAPGRITRHAKNFL